MLGFPIADCIVFEGKTPRMIQEMEQWMQGGGEARLRIVIYVKRKRNSPILMNWKRWLGRMGEAVTSSWFRGQALGLDAKVKLWVPACH